jgi:6 kDa early secretory antigenic target
MMTRYQVDSEEVFGAAGAVRASAARIEAEVGGMLAQLTSLQGSWVGQAATAFTGVIEEWRATQQRVVENLGAINQALGQAGAQYAETEQANAQLFRR